MYNKMHSPIGTAESCTDDVLTTFQFDLPFSVVLTGLLDLGTNILKGTLEQ